MVTAVRDLVRSQLKKYTATPADDYNFCRLSSLRAL